MTKPNSRRFVDARQGARGPARCNIDDTCPADQPAACRARRLIAERQGFGRVDTSRLPSLVAGDRQRRKPGERNLRRSPWASRPFAKECTSRDRLSQLSRQWENREDKRPQLSDLRESGSDRTGCRRRWMFVFARKYYKEREKRRGYELDKWRSWQERWERPAGRAEVVIGKQRHGPIGHCD